MEKRKINFITIIVICILSVIIGMGVGYFIFIGLDKNAIQNVQSSTNLDETNSENIITYDGSKNIILNGKKYTISYLSEKIEHFNNSEIEQTEVKLFLDNKYIGTVNLRNITDIKKTYGSYGYDVELYTLSQDYILVMLKTEYNTEETGDMSRRVFFILNTDGIHIDTLEWFNGTHIMDNATNKELKYEIDNEGIILYEVNGNGATKTKYVPIRNVIKEELVKVYNENEVSLAGK